MAALVAHAEWQGGFASVVDDGRGHSISIDLPSEEGGKDRGTSALELSVLSLAGCIVTIFAIVARKRRLAYTGLTLDLAAERSEGAPTIERVTGSIRLETTADLGDVETAVRRTVQICPVGVLVDRAGVSVQLDVKVVAPPSPPEATGPATATA